MNRSWQQGRSGAMPAWLLIAFALAIKAIMPAGYMPAFTAHGMAVVLCSGMAPGTTMVVAVPASPGSEKSDHDGGPAAPCAFAGLFAPALAGADPIQLAMAIAVVIATALFFTPVAAMAPLAFVRPPLRGPPHSA